MIRSLHLRDFKSFCDVEVPLGPFTLVVGTNASGKSNLRDALRFLHGVGLGYSLADIFGEKYGAGGVKQWQGIRGGLPEAIRKGRPAFDISLVFDGADRSQAMFYGIQVRITDDRKPYAHTETLRYDDVEWAQLPGGWVAHGDGAIVHLVFAPDPVAPEHAHPLPANTPALGQVVEEAAIRGIDPPRTRLDTLTTRELFASMRFLDLHPDAMRVASNPGQTVLGDRGENLSSVLQAICQDPALKTTLLEWIRALTPLDATELTFETDFSGRILVHLVEASGAKLSAASVSDGTLRFLAMVAALLSEDTGRIYVFEELDNGIHPTRLHLLLDLIERACDEQGIQVIATTHNPAMLAFLGERAREHALLVYRGEDHCSRIRRVMDLPGIENAIGGQDLGQLLLTGWLDDAAAFSEPEASAQPEPGSDEKEP